MKTGCKTTYCTQDNTKWASNGLFYCGNELIAIGYSWQGWVGFAKGDSLVLNPTPTNSTKSFSYGKT